MIFVSIAHALHSIKMLIIENCSFSGEPRHWPDRLRRVGKDLEAVPAQVDHRRRVLLLAKPRLRKVQKNRRRMWRHPGKTFTPGQA